MALFPKIDQACPLGIDAQKRINGYCGHCSKHVQALDGMNDAERGAFLRNATGPVCVSYRVPLRRGMSAGLGAALVLSLAGPVRAADAPVPAPTEARGLHATKDIAPAVPQVSVAEPPKPEVMLTGGVSNPADAQMVEEDDVPELPIVSETVAPGR
jgi:hypothetical protein